MANNPNDTNPSPIPPDDQPDLPPPADPSQEFDLEDLPEIADLADLDLAELPDDAAVPEAAPEPIPEPEPAVPDADAVSFDEPVPNADPASFTRGMVLEDLADLADLPEIPPTPEAQELPVPEAADLEPVSPVAPASGWLDSDEVAPKPVETGSGLFAEPVEVQSDVLGAGPVPVVESSDIFAAGPVAQARPVDHSDVIAATAYGEATSADSDSPAKPARPSEIALSFDQPPGGSTVQEVGGSGDLPVAEEVPEAEELPPDSGSLFDSVRGESLFDSVDQAAEAELPPAPARPARPHDAPDFGASPIPTPDASSILADLTEPDEPHFHDSSAVKLEAPGMGRTLSSNPDDATEFDLTVDDDEFIPPELTEAAEAAEATSADEPTDWRDQAGSDLFADARTAPELDLDDASGRVFPVDPALPAEEPSLTSAPSSIFSDKAKSSPGTGASDGSAAPLGAAPKPEDEDSAVEFSLHPEAEDEATASRIFGSPSPGPMPRPPVAPKPPTAPPVPAATEDDGGVIDWDLTADEDEATIGFPHARLDAPPSGILKRGKGSDPEADLPARKPAPTEDDAADATAFDEIEAAEPADPSVEIDWIAGSSTSEPVVTDSAESPAVADEVEEVSFEAPTREAKPARGKASPAKAKTSPAREKAPSPAEKPAPTREKTSPARDTAEPRRSGKGGWVGGTLLGIVLGGGAFAGAYFGDLLPKDPPTAGKPAGDSQLPPGVNPGATAAGVGPATVADVAAAVRAGDPTRAKQIAATLKDSTVAGKAAQAEATLFSLIQESGKTSTPIAADNADLKAAREHLEALVKDDAATTAEGEKAAVKAAIQLGVTHELAGDRAAARKVYEDARAKFPKFASTFDASLDRLDATAPAAAPVVPDGTSRRPDRLNPADARHLLLAITLLQADPADPEAPAPKAAGDADAEAGVFFWKAVNKATTTQFAEAIELLDKARAAHIKQAKAKAGGGLNPLSDPLEQMFPRCCDDLKAYWELRAAIYSKKSVADAFKSGADKAVAALADAQTKAAAAVTLMADLKDATDKLAKATTDLKKAETDAKDAKDLVAKLEKDVKAETDAKVAVEKKLEAEEKARKDADAAKQKTDEFVGSLAKELQAAKLLGDKFDAAELLAAQKRAADRASGPNLTTLVTPGMMAVGAGLSSAQLIDIAERLTKSETAAKVATDKLAAETKRLTGEHTAALKKLADDHAAATKKLTDAYATETAKLKDDQTAELKKMADKYVADAKKLTEGFEGKIKDLDATIAKEKERAEAAAAQFKRDLGNAISPTQALDLWLPMLVELRRPSDSDAALANAQKVIASAAADSEDAAKARTVAGLALLYKNEMPLAKAMFQAAKSNPTYEPAAKAKKLWAVAAETGLDSVTDPLAAYRQTPELPKRDPVLAARHLDAGVKAYRAGQFADAVNALTESTKADPNAPVAWYFLGAAKWALGSTDAAKDDFRQGAAREKVSDVPSRILNGALAPIQGSARDALGLARP